MPTAFDDVCCARIPRDSLALLACLRIEPGLRACLTEQHAWLRWDAGNERVLRAVMPIHDALLYCFHDGRWHRFGHALPDFEFPIDLHYQPLAHLLFPMPVQPIPVPATSWQALRMTLERDDRPRATTAMRCTLQALSAWSDTVGTQRLASLRAVVQRDEMLILGRDLPILENACRYWGHDILIPIGYAPSIAIAESVLRESGHVADEDLFVWEPQRTMTVPRASFTAMSRASLRLCMREARR